LKFGFRKPEGQVEDKMVLKIYSGLVPIWRLNCEMGIGCLFMGGYLMCFVKSGETDFYT
jgi:hypothetical protein